VVLFCYGILRRQSGAVIVGYNVLSADNYWTVQCRRGKV
jgi:hypothetical protein